MVIHYFRTGFRAIGHSDCLFLMNRWLGLIEPRTPQDLAHRREDGHRPPWWPEDVVYTQSLDKIEGTDRISLLILIMLHAGRDTLADSPRAGHGCPAKQLQQEILYRLDELTNPNSHEILEEMFHVRTVIEWREIGKRVMITSRGAQIGTPRREEDFKKFWGWRLH